VSGSFIDIVRYSELFLNGQVVYGSFVLGSADESGKVRGKADLVYATPTQAVFQRHCLGTHSMGLSPMNGTDGKVKWGAIDIDDYPNHKLSTIVRAIYDFNMPLLPFYSKSKKLHLFMFLTDTVDASRMRILLQRYANVFDCKPRTELFPKQTETSLTSKRQSSWINLPYFGNTRCLLDRSMNELDITDAIERIYDKKMSFSQHEALIDELPYADAPPCIQKGAILRDFDSTSHCRNNFLFSASVYWRLKDENDDIEQRIIDLNNSFDEPIEESRLKSTVLSGIKKKTYFYLCNDMPGCDKALCRKTPYGIESKFSTGLDYGQIEQWLEDPPYYTWTVNGQRMTFFSEVDIINQHKFREQAYRYLHIMPRRVKDEIWSKIVNRASSDHIVHEVEVIEGGFSTGSQFLSHTIAFFTSRRLADNFSQLALGRTYKDEGRNVYIFSSSAFVAFLRNVKDFRAYTPIEMQSKLKELGAKQEGKYWTIPVDIIGQREETESIEIDFHDQETGEEIY
jgi:hypothetical protein